jgi:hypothetical protein
MDWYLKHTILGDAVSSDIRYSRWKLRPIIEKPPYNQIAITVIIFGNLFLLATMTMIP